MTEIFEHERDFRVDRRSGSPARAASPTSPATPTTAASGSSSSAEISDDLDPRSTVIVLGDARTNGREPHAEVFAQVSERAGRLFWLNPEPQLYWNYGDSVMAAYERYCDGAFECWTTRHLENFVNVVAGGTPRDSDRLAGGPGVWLAESSSTTSGSSPETRSARVTCSSTARRLARTAIQTSCRCSALPRYSIDSGGVGLDVGDRPLDRADEVGDRHLVGRTGQPVAALGAAAGADDAGVLELEQDVLEELQRDVLRLGEPLALDRALAGGGQLGRRPHGVVGLRGDAHGAS